jgi:hypothetical protein
MDLIIKILSTDESGEVKEEKDREATQVSAESVLKNSVNLDQKFGIQSIVDSVIDSGSSSLVNS